MKRILLSVIVAGSAVSYAQDVHFSQVYNNPLHINPANVGGFQGYERVILNYRSQWASAGSPYNTMGFSYDMPMFQKDGSKTCLGLGLSVYSDKAGASKLGTTYPALTVAAIVPVSAHSKFTSALQFGYLMRSINLSGVTWASQYDGKEYDASMAHMENFGSTSVGAFDMALGLRYAHEVKKETFQGFIFNKFDVGAALYHVTQPKFNFLVGNDQIPFKIVGHASCRIDMKDANVSFLPYTATFFQGKYKEINGGLMVRYKLSEGTKITGFLTESAIYFGLHYRADDALVPQIMYEYGSWGIGVSYDLTTSNYSQINNLNGGFEVSVKWHDLKGAIFKKRVNATVY